MPPKRWYAALVYRLQDKGIGPLSSRDSQVGFLCFLVSLATLAGIACHTKGRVVAAPRFDFSTQVGLAARGSEGLCVELPGTSLSQGKQVTLVGLPKPQRTIQVELTRLLDKTCLPEESDLKDSHFYLATTPPDADVSSEIFIVLYGFSGPFSVRDDIVTADLDGDGKPEFFRECTSTEGVHLTIWSDKLLRGKYRWHAYYYLGYDVEPTCTSQETASGV